MARRRRRVPVTVAIVVAALVLAGLNVMFLPPFRLAERFSKPAFCAGCHNMEPEYAAFRASPHRGLASCNDCHLPNGDPVSHFFWDGVFGTRDLVEFYVLGRAPYDERATDLSKRIIEANCVRCHSRTVEHVDVSARACWECHRVMYHRVQLEAAGRDLFGGMRQ